jgi:hypothetical protein
MIMDVETRARGECCGRYLVRPVRRSRFLTVALLCGAIAGCGGGDSAKRSPATTPKPEAAATPAPSPLTFGSQRYISPCSVLPMDAVERIYGPMKALGYVRQQFYDASMPEAEFKRVTDSITHSSGPSATTTGATRTARAHRSRSTSSARRRPHVPSGRRSPTSAPARRAASSPSERAGTWTSSPSSRARTSATLSFVTPVFTSRQYRTQAAKAKQAFRVIYRQLDRGDLAQMPLGPTVGDEQGVNDVRCLDPCRVLTEKVFQLATGRAATENVESESLPVDTARLRKAADDLYGQSPDASCRRSARYKRKPSDRTSRNDYADLSVRVAAQPQGDQVLSVGTQLAQD